MDPARYTEFRTLPCERMVQEPAPSRPIPRSLAGPSLLAFILVSKFDDHVPLYRLNEIFARMGADIPDTTLVDWCGRAMKVLKPLIDRIDAKIMASDLLHADDTPIRVLDRSQRDKGLGKGVKKGRIDLNRFVALTATNHAKLYGLYPRKGTIAVGSDADIAIWDPDRHVTLSQDIMHHGCDYTPYEGIQVTGWPETVILRGTPIIRDGRLVASPGAGTYLPRGPSSAVPAA